MTSEEKRIKERERSRGRRKALHAYVRNIKSTTPCADCQLYYHYSVMEFDHVLGIKHKDVSRMLRGPKSFKALHDEIAKCELVCANCHRLRTFWRQSQRLGTFTEDLAYSTRQMAQIEARFRGDLVNLLN